VYPGQTVGFPAQLQASLGNYSQLSGEFRKSPRGYMPLPRNLVLDCKTVAAMTRIFCHDHHGTGGTDLCESCAELVEYAAFRLSKCPFGARKTTCRMCAIHCYRPGEQVRMKVVMRYAGPRMLWRHPFLAARHLWLDRSAPPELPRRRQQTTA
jgi:hypothetical protein